MVLIKSCVAFDVLWLGFGKKKVWFLVRPCGMMKRDDSNEETRFWGKETLSKDRHD